MKINSSLAKYPSQFFGDLFIFNWYQARQHFENRDFAAERTINRSELHAHSPGPYDDQRLGNFLERQDFDVVKKRSSASRPGQMRASHPVERIHLLGLI